MASTLDPALLAIVTSHHVGVLVTLKRDGRPQLSTVGYTFDPESATVRISVTDSRAKTRNLRRDPRCSFFITSDGMGPYAVLEGTANLSPVAGDPNDATVNELVDVYRAIGGKEHPDWDEYRAAMVADGRLVLSFVVERAYGFAPS